MFLKVNNMEIELTNSEKFQIQYLLPVQGNIKTLLLVQQILNKINIELGDEKSLEIIKINFTEEEFLFLNEMIIFLNNNHRLNLKSLPLILKLQKTR